MKRNVRNVVTSAMVFFVLTVARQSNRTFVSSGAFLSPLPSRFLVMDSIICITKTHYSYIYIEGGGHVHYYLRHTKDT